MQVFGTRSSPGLHTYSTLAELQAWLDRAPAGVCMSGGVMRSPPQHHRRGEAARVMHVWLRHQGRLTAPAEAPLSLHNLDQASSGLRRHAELLRPLVAE